jgi:hypothetical protein
MDDPRNIEPLWKLAAWFTRRDWLFWITFIPLLILKLAIFHFAASTFLVNGYHPYYGMDFEAVEAFSDFSFYYMNFVRAFVQGNLPYTEALYVVDGSQTYIYPPLFVYILSGFYYIPSELLFPDIQITAILLSRNLDFLRVGFAFIIFDVATCAVMYTAARQLTENRFIPIVVMFLFALNPLSLWWGNYLWLSTPMHTFFLVFGFYFMIRGNLRWAVVWVTVAAMVKQTAALLIPLIWFLEYRHGVKRLLVSVAVTACIGILFSMPYLFLYPATYLNSLARGLGPYPFYDALPGLTHPISISILAFYWPEPFKFVVFALIYYAVPWTIALTLLWVVSYLIPKQPSSTYRGQLLLIALLLTLAAHIFLPRGIYKFYLIAMIPFLILFGAVLQGPIVPTQRLPCPFQRRAVKWMTHLPSWMVDIIHRVQIHNLEPFNNVAVWWFIMVGLASITIFAIHRYFTHIILLALFLLLLVCGAYCYVWQWYVKKRNLERKK